jgi:hypothetical protein
LKGIAFPSLFRSFFLSFFPPSLFPSFNSFLPCLLLFLYLYFFPFCLYLFYPFLCRSSIIFTLFLSFFFSLFPSFLLSLYLCFVFAWSLSRNTSWRPDICRSFIHFPKENSRTRYWNSAIHTHLFIPMQLTMNRQTSQKSIIKTMVSTPCSRILAKLIVTHLLKKFPSFQGTWRFTTVFKRAPHSSLFWAR